jgi:uncharacterized protein DUF6289
MRGIEKRNRLTVVAMAVFAAASIYVTSLTPAKAVIIDGPNVCTYYSDAKMKTAVGARGTGCCGSVISWGIVTAYKKCQAIYCTDQSCPN